LDGSQLLISASDQVRSGNNFDAIRLAMATLVVWSHSFALYYGTESFEPISLALNGTYNAGNIAVLVFFIVSGFLITRSFVTSSSTKSFISKRIRRIYPGYLVATSLCAFVVIPLYSSIRDKSLLEIIKTFTLNLFLRNYFPPSNAFTANPAANAINGSLWSIPFEFWCYIGVAALGVTGFLSKKRALLVFAVLVLIGRVVLDLLGRKPGWGFIGLVFGWPYMWFIILPCFLLGMLAYCYRNYLPRSRALLVVLTAMTTAAAWISPHVTHLLLPPALAYGVFYVAFSESIRLHKVVKFGDFSYGTYLYAFTIQQMLYASLGHTLSFGGYLALSLCFSLSAGICSWFFVERWFVINVARGRLALGEVSSARSLP